MYESKYRVDEGFMDTMKSGWKKIKKAFANRPEVQLVGDNGQKEIGYLHDINTKKGTCTFMLPNKTNESAAVAAAVAAGLAMRGGGGRGNDGERRKPKELKPKFSKGEKVTLVGADEDLGSNKIPVEIEGVNNCGSTYMYFLKLLKTPKEEVNEMKRRKMNEERETNPRFKCMEALDIVDIYDNKAWYELTLEDEDGETRVGRVDVTEEEDWGNINTVDGACYFPSGEDFDGIGYGNDEDGYEKIVKVVDLNTGRRVPLEQWAEFVDSLTELFSDM